MDTSVKVTALIREIAAVFGEQARISRPVKRIAKDVDACTTSMTAVVEQSCGAHLGPAGSDDRVKRVVEELIAQVGTQLQIGKE